MFTNNNYVALISFSVLQKTFGNVMKDVHVDVISTCTYGVCHVHTALSSTIHILCFLLCHAFISFFCGLLTCSTPVSCGRYVRTKRGQ